MTTEKTLDNWDEQMRLADAWAEAGGTRNKRVAGPFLRRANAMEKRLRSAGIPHPLEAQGTHDDSKTGTPSNR